MGMRVGGAFPLNQAGAFPITLTGGEYVYPPPGNYAMTLGAQTCLQWWDPVLYTWRNVSQPNAESFLIDVDGYNWRLINLSGVVQAASITNAGSGGTNGIGPTQTGSTVTFAASGGQPGSQATGYVVVGGAVGTAGGSITVTQAGSGFVYPPLILIDPPPIGGIQATATATITAGGAINTATIVNPGAGYTSVPNVYIVPQFANYPGAPTNPYTLPATGLPQPYYPPGVFGTLLPPQTWMSGLTVGFPTASQAQLTAPALTGSGTLTGLVMTNYGFGYTSVPAITFGGTSLGAAAATSIMSWALTALSTSAQTNVTAGAPWISAMGLLNVPGSAFNNNNLLQPRPARGRTTSSSGAQTIEDPGFGIQIALAAANFGITVNATTAPVVTFSGPTMGGVTDTSILQMMAD